MRTRFDRDHSSAVARGVTAVETTLNRPVRDLMKVAVGSRSPQGSRPGRQRRYTTVELLEEDAGGTSAVGGRTRTR